MQLIRSTWDLNPGYVGQIKQVKVLGGLALNDVSRFILSSLFARRSTKTI
jgi:hypothetical protein